MGKRIVGIILLCLMVGAAVAYKQQKEHKAATAGTVLKGLVGSEKVALLENPHVQELLREQHDLALDVRKAGSLEMVSENTDEYDFLWPGSQVAVELYKAAAKPLSRSSVIFNSPIVFYSWDTVTDALVQQGLVEKKGESYFIKDLKRLLLLTINKDKWSSLGLTALYGNVKIISTDPLRSNSGTQFAALIANVLNDGEVVTEATIDKTLPHLKAYFANLGYMEGSSAVLFDQFLRTGVGAFPIIVGYENSLVEFALQNKEVWQSVKGRMRILYPIPTMWSSHELIAIKPKASELIRALESKELQRIAWEEHGFRSGLLGAQNDPAVLGVVGIPDRIEQIISMPSAKVMDRILAEFRAK